MNEIFLDTTYLFPFLQVPVAVRGFKVSAFSRLIRSVSRVHFAELSIYEAKAKLLRLSRTRKEYDKPLRSFGINLDALRLDDKFTFHVYQRETDESLNQLLPFVEGLDAFDMILLSDAVTVGFLLTEDEDLLSLGHSKRFVESKLSKKIKIRNWRGLSSGKLSRR